jgi:hypothetical protein
MKTAVLIPSHIYYADQLGRLNTCLESLYSQTVVPDIFVSISFANDTYKSEFSTLLRKYPNVNFKVSAKQKFQMEHLYTLSLLVSDYDMIMFCDDDDTYLPIRVEKFIEGFQTGKDQCDKTGIQFGGVREVKDVEDINDPFEYWAYGIPPSLLIQFFKLIKGYEDLMRHKFADMYLRNYIKRTGGTSKIFATFVPVTPGLNMYCYTVDNPNSICARHRSSARSKNQTLETATTVIRDNLTVGLICDYIDIVKKHMVAASIPFSRLNEIVPDIDRIKILTNILYK